jgi:hypothetical protein
MKSRCCLCVSVYPPSVARQRLGKNPLIVARQQLSKNLLIVARQRLGRNVTAVTNAHATIAELFDASFSMWPVVYQGKWAISSSQNFLFLFRNASYYVQNKQCPNAQIDVQYSNTLC